MVKVIQSVDNIKYGLVPIEYILKSSEAQAGYYKLSQQHKDIIFMPVTYEKSITAINSAIEAFSSYVLIVTGNMLDVEVIFRCIKREDYSRIMFQDELNENPALRLISHDSIQTKIKIKSILTPDERLGYLRRRNIRVAEHYRLPPHKDIILINIQINDIDSINVITDALKAYPRFILIVADYTLNMHEILKHIKHEDFSRIVFHDELDDNRIVKVIGEESSESTSGIDSMLTAKEKHGYLRLRDIRVHEEVLLFDAQIFDKNSAGMLIQALTEYSSSIFILTNYRLHISEIFQYIPAEDTARLFLREELAINPTFGTMALKHRRANAREIAQLQRDKLPKLVTRDVQRRWNNFAPGEVIAIERSQTETYYRLVENITGIMDKVRNLLT